MLHFIVLFLMESNYIYLLKEREFINSNQDIYKIGMTTKPNHQRFHQYPKGSILLFQIICSDCHYYEKKLIALFKEKFILRKDIGNEYFEGDYEMMIDYIYVTIRNKIQIYDVAKEIEDEKKEVIEEKDNEIKEVIDEKEEKEEKENKEDENTQQQIILFKLTDDGQYYCHYWNHAILLMEEYCLSEVMDDNERNYFIHLLINNIICLNTPYDLHNVEWIHSIMAQKTCIDIERFHEFLIVYPQLENTIESKVFALVCLNVVINQTVFATINENIYKYIHQLNDFDSFDVDIGRFVCKYKSKHISIHLICSKYYCYETCLSKFMPYEIRWDKNNNYGYFNRRNEFIQSFSECQCQYKWIGSYILYNDSNKPWESKKKYQRFLKEHQKIIDEKKLSSCFYQEKWIFSLLYK